MEALDVGLVRRALVADQDPGDEDGEEAGAVRQRGQAEEHAGAGEHPQGVERRRGQRRPPDDPEQGPAADEPTTAPTTICEVELQDALADGREPPLPARSRDGHQRDADRVVGARLALEQDAAASLDLTAAEDREHDDRIRWCQSGPDQEAVAPGQAEDQMREQAEHRCRQRGARRPRSR